jgi:hypothetical protein
MNTYYVRSTIHTPRFSIPVASYFDAERVTRDTLEAWKIVIAHSANMPEVTPSKVFIDFYRLLDP